MRKLISLAIVVTLASVVVLAAPQIAVDKDAYEFGSIVEGSFVRHTFIVSNVGSAALVITEARSVSTCPCTTVLLRSNTVEPGASTEFEVIWNTGGYGGRSTGWSFYIESNDPETPMLSLTLEGVVEMAGPNHLPLQYLQYDLYALVDLRTPDAYAQEHILGAVNIPFEDLEEYIGRLSLEHMIIFYGNDEVQSEDAVQLMLSEGYREGYVVSLYGGLSAWRAARGATWAADPLSPIEERETAAPGRFGDSGFTVQQLQRWVFAMIDVRTAEEYADGHIFGAINIPYEQLDEYLDILPRNTMLVIYDDDGTVSDRAMERMMDGGLTLVQSLIGGISLWFEALGSTMIWPVP